jgi:hypothetical protein
MRQDILQDHLLEILENSFACKQCPDVVNEALALTDEDMFRLWNLLGEELGIDLSLVTPEQRKALFDSCQGGKRLVPSDFGTLLWLIYYAEPLYQ